MSVCRNLMIININKNNNLKLTQIYAPRTTHTEEEVKEFYEKITEGLNNYKSTPHINYCAKFERKLEKAELKNLDMEHGTNEKTTAYGLDKNKKILHQEFHLLEKTTEKIDVDFSMRHHKKMDNILTKKRYSNRCHSLKFDIIWK